jgi:hypothetical protein
MTNTFINPMCKDNADNCHQCPGMKLANAMLALEDLDEPAATPHDLQRPLENSFNETANGSTDTAEQLGSFEVRSPSMLWDSIETMGSIHNDGF